MTSSEAEPPLQKSKSIRQPQKEFSDRNFLLLNHRFAGMLDALELKSGQKPELGRILTDKGYATQLKKRTGGIFGGR